MPAPPTINNALSSLKPVQAPPMPSANQQPPQQNAGTPQQSPPLFKPSVTAQLGRQQGGHQAVQANIRDMFTPKQADVLTNLFINNLPTRKLAALSIAGESKPKDWNGSMSQPSKENGGVRSDGYAAISSIRNKKRSPKQLGKIAADDPAATQMDFNQLTNRMGYGNQTNQTQPGSNQPNFSELTNRMGYGEQTGGQREPAPDYGYGAVHNLPGFARTWGSEGDEWAGNQNVAAQRRQLLNNYRQGVSSNINDPSMGANQTPAQGLNPEPTAQAPAEQLPVAPASTPVAPIRNRYTRPAPAPRPPAGPTPSNVPPPGPRAPMQRPPGLRNLRLPRPGGSANPALPRPR